MPRVDRRLADIDRPLLERYLAWLADPAGRARRQGRPASPACTCCFQRSASTAGTTPCPPRRCFFAGDSPPPPDHGCSRRLAEHVMAQIEAPANLDRWPDPAARLVTLILIRCGLRVSDACTLALRLPAPRRPGRPLPALRQPQDAPRGRGPDRRGARGRDPRPAAPGPARWPDGTPLPVSPAHAPTPPGHAR